MSTSSSVIEAGIALVRRLDEGVIPEEDPSSGGYGSGEFDPKVFWSVNALILFLIFFSCMWCFRLGGSDMLSRRRDSDEEYRQTILARREREAARRRESPEKRRRKLLQSFRRNDVSMVVEESDLVGQEETVGKPGEATDESTSVDAAVPVDFDLEAATSGFLVLRVDGQPLARVPNCCAICLGNYEVGDKVVWSSNEECPHAFHEDCMVDWLTKMTDGTPCPCCRADFTDLENSDGNVVSPGGLVRPSMLVLFNCDS